MFSRNFESQNSKHWQVEAALRGQLSSLNKSFIVDGEIVYVDPQGKFLPFQAIERKLQTEESTLLEDKLPKLFLFDILALGEKSLCHLELRERRKYLDELVQTIQAGTPKVVELAKSFSLGDSDQLEARIDELQASSLEAGCEGIIVKSDLAPYETGGIRSSAWTKFKGSSLGSSLGDTIDLVPIGGYYGRGLRTGVFGSYLMAAYNA